MVLDADALTPLVDEGLGNSAWLLDLGDGRALAVDPPRDLRMLERLARRRRLRVAFAADTHLHADFLSGARQLAASDDTVILASAAGRRAFGHRGLRDGDEVDLGGLTLRAAATPGHTDEHLSYLLLDGAAAIGVFTGGSLIVGAAARTDLLGAERAEELARAQFSSLRHLAQLPDSTGVWPTHGAGSFCSAPSGAQRSSTIGREKATNRLLSAPDVEAFVAALTASLGSYPAYFGRLAEVNRRGPEVIVGEPGLPALDHQRVRALMADGALVLDVRPVADVAAGHIPGAVSIELRAQFATWLGWLVDPDAPLVVVRNPDQPAADIIWPALNIGYQNLLGELAGGLAAWAAAGGPVATTRLVGPEAIDTPVLDVRQDSEFAAGHLPGSVHIELGELPATSSNMDVTPRVIMCGHGHRAMTAATLLERSGHRDLSVFVGSAGEWARATGARLDVGG